MSVDGATQLKMSFVGGSGVGKTSLIFGMTQECLPNVFRPFTSDPPHVKYVDFNPSSYQPECHGTEKRKDGKMLAEKRQAFWLICEDYDGRRVLSYTDAAVIALCFSVAKRETFDLIRTKVRRVYFT